MKTKFFVTGSLIASFCFFGCNKDKDNDDENNKDVLIETITLSSIDELGIGQEVKVYATLTPLNANEAVKWDSENSDIATVTPVPDTNGKEAMVKANDVGQVTIYATNQDGTIKKELTVTVIPSTWVNVTAAFLTNFKMPFAHGATPLITQGDPGAERCNYAVEGGWITNDVGSANGNVFDNGGVFNFDLTLQAWTDPAFPLGSFVNGKLYQKVDLKAGTYKFYAYFLAAYTGVSYTVYMAAASGDGLPDTDAVGDALASLHIEGLSNAIDPPDDRSIEFTLSEDGAVSMGFVGDFDNAEIHIGEVKLEQFK